MWPFSQLCSVFSRCLSRQDAEDEDYYELDRLEDSKAPQGAQQPTQGGLQVELQMPQPLDRETNATKNNDPTRPGFEPSDQAALLPHVPCDQKKEDKPLLHGGTSAPDQELQSDLHKTRVLAFPKPLHFKTALHSEKDVGLLAFYYPGREEAWDALCQAGFLGNFYQLPEPLHLTAPSFPGREHVFLNAEAAFQALKFWGRASEFEQLSGEESFQLKVKLRGQEDFTYGGYGGNWQAMMAVLKAKFSAGSLMGNTLCSTGDAFLLEHTPRRGRDNIWSDDCDGEGQNWLGLQLMFRRMELQGSSSWLAYLEAAYDLSNGRKAKDVHQWQDMVRAATKTLLTQLHG